MFISQGLSGKDKELVNMKIIKIAQDNIKYCTYDEAREGLIKWQLSDSGFLLKSNKRYDEYYPNHLNEITKGWDKEIASWSFYKKRVPNFSVTNLLGHNDPRMIKKYPNLRPYATLKDAREKIIEWQLLNGVLLSSNQKNKNHLSNYLEKITSGWDKRIPNNAYASYKRKSKGLSLPHLLGHNDPRIIEKYNIKDFATYSEAREKLIEWQLSENGVLLSSDRLKEGYYRTHLDEVTKGWDKKLPMEPNSHYKGVNMTKFLGYDDPRIQQKFGVSPRDLRPKASYLEARQKILDWQLSDEGSLLVSSRRVGKEYFRDHLQEITKGWDKRIPTHPDDSYKGEGFTNFANFLGYDDPRMEKKYEIEETRSIPSEKPYSEFINFAISKRIASNKGWLEYCKLNGVPEGMQLYPWLSYQGFSWAHVWSNMGLGARPLEQRDCGERYETNPAYLPKSSFSNKNQELIKLIQSIIYGTYTNQVKVFNLKRHVTGK